MLRLFRLSRIDNCDSLLVAAHEKKPACSLRKADFVIVCILHSDRPGVGFFQFLPVSSIRRSSLSDL